MLDTPWKTMMQYCDDNQEEIYGHGAAHMRGRENLLLLAFEGDVFNALSFE